MKNLPAALAAALLLVLAQVPAAHAGYGEIMAENACHLPVRVFVRYLARSGWKQSGWHDLGANESMFLYEETGRLKHKAGENFFYYAETTRGRAQKWQGHALETVFRGRHLSLRESRSRPDYFDRTQLYISCSPRDD